MLLVFFYEICEEIISIIVIETEVRGVEVGKREVQFN